MLAPAVRLTSLTLVVVAFVGCASEQIQPSPSSAPLTVGELTSMDGRIHDVDAALDRGETVALIFWQTWCESCETEAPRISAAAADNAGTIRFLGVVPGRDAEVDAGEVRAVADTWGYATFPHVRDRDQGLCERLGVSATPTILVLGQSGEVLYRGHRAPKDWRALQGVEFDPQSDGGCEGGVCPLPTDD